MTFRKTLTEIAPPGAIAVIAPHPDDETLGCGGLLALAAAAGRPTVVVLLTDGAASHPRSELPIASLRLSEIRRALSVLGHESDVLVALGLADGALDAADPAAVVARLTEVLRSWGVASVFVTGPQDPHPDHRQAYVFASEAARRVGAIVWIYPVRAPSTGSALRPGHVRLSIDDVVDLKARALRCHASQWPGGVADDPDGFHLTAADLTFHLAGEELYTAG
jgi:LmbE family N-acetylglucosaminyl deacetylase